MTVIKECEFCGRKNVLGFEDTTDPYGEDLYGDTEVYDICEECIKNRADDI